MALPLLALGARLAASQGVRAGATQAVRKGATSRAASATAGGAGGAAASRGMGFKDIVKETTSIKNNVISFRGGNQASGQMSSTGGAAPAIVATPSPQQNTNVVNDIQAASELSMDELAKQTKILDEIKQNTQQTATNTQSMVGVKSGAAPAPPSEEEIKGRFGKTGAVMANIGKKADEKIPTSLTSFLAAASAFALTTKGAPENTRAATEADLTAASGLKRSAAFSEIFQADKVFGKASEEEIAANKSKRDAIVKRIERAGRDPAKQEKEIQELDKAFQEGNYKKVQAFADKYRMAGDKDTGAYQFRNSAAKFGVAEAEEFATSLGEEGVSDLERLNQAREALENNPEQLAKEEKAFRDKQLALRTERERKTSEELYKAGFLGTQSAEIKKEQQLEQVEEAVAASFGNEGFFGGILESGKRIAGDIFGFETEQEKAEKGILDKIAAREKEMRDNGASERDIINMRKDMLAQLEGRAQYEVKQFGASREFITDAEKLRQQSEESVRVTTQMDREYAAEQQAMAAAAASGGNQQAPIPTPNVEATAILTDPTTKDSVGNMLKKLNDMRSAGAL